jgi:Protein of unknown function (DUF2442)
MTFLPSVVRAKYIGGFRIQLTFNDASEAIVDFQQWLEGPVFELLKSPTYFRKFFVEGGAVVWPNGADVAPEALYDAAQATRANKQMEPTRAGSRSRAAHS